MRRIFIINPTAGKGKHTEAMRESIAAAAAANGAEVEIYVTTSAGDGERYVRETASSGEPVCFFACGGDGTLNEVVNGAYGFDNVTVGCVPVGSGNDSVKSYTHPERFADLGAQLSGRDAMIDVIKCNDRYCINLANIGFDCDCARRMSKYKKLPLLSGPMAYNLAVLVTFLCRMGTKLKVTFPDGDVHEGQEILTAVGNGICYGGGYYATPRALLDDGLLDVSLIAKMPRLTVAKLIGVYKAGEHLTHPGFKPYLYVRRVPEAVIESPEPIQLCLDGEIVQESRRVAFSIAEKPLRFHLPEGVELLATASQPDPAQPIPV